MKISIILAHPDPGSFNHAIAEAAASRLHENGHAVTYHDLYTEQFDPILPAQEVRKDAILPAVIRRHCDELADTDGLIIVHPNWWGQPPAILKGWIDRVLRPGVAYRFVEGDGGEGIPVGLLKARAALVFNTSNTLAAREQSAFGDPLESLWNRCIFPLCGIPVFYRRMFGVVVTSSVAERAGWLREVRDCVAEYFPQEVGKADSKQRQG